MCPGTRFGKQCHRTLLTDFSLGSVGQTGITTTAGIFLEHLLCAEHVRVIQHWQIQCQPIQISKSDAVEGQAHVLSGRSTRETNEASSAVWKCWSQATGGCLTSRMEFQELSAVGLKFLCFAPPGNYHSPVTRSHHRTFL